MQGQAQLGQQYQGAAAEKPVMSVAEVICDKFTDMRRVVQSATRRVRQVADTLKGQEPSPINKGESASGQIMARTVSACHDEVRDELTELNRQIDRLFVD